MPFTSIFLSIYPKTTCYLSSQSVYLIELSKYLFSSQTSLNHTSEKFQTVKKIKKIKIELDYKKIK
jgi:hypothetical protein